MRKINQILLENMQQGQIRLEEGYEDGTEDWKQARNYEYEDQMNSQQKGNRVGHGEYVVKLRTKDSSLTMRRNMT